MNFKTQIEKDLEAICLFCIKNISDDMLQVYIDYSVLYSRKYWLYLLEEKLRRIENEIIVI
jgi:hypothetical protein